MTGVKRAGITGQKSRMAVAESENNGAEIKNNGAKIGNDSAITPSF